MYKYIHKHIKILPIIWFYRDSMIVRRTLYIILAAMPFGDLPLRAFERKIPRNSCQKLFLSIQNTE